MALRAILLLPSVTQHLFLRTLSSSLQPPCYHLPTLKLARPSRPILIPSYPLRRLNSNRIPSNDPSSTTARALPLRRLSQSCPMRALVELLGSKSATSILWIVKRAKARKLRAKRLKSLGSGSKRNRRRSLDSEISRGSSASSSCNTHPKRA